MFERLTTPDPVNTMYFPPSPPAEDSDNCINPQVVTIPTDLSLNTISPPESLDGEDSPDDAAFPDYASSSDPSQQSKKKRKSWGQILPAPTTNLPPRKRAKTEAEKEQRKYERVQRNRQAAHNSRMRKQLEMEHLSDKNKALEDKCKAQKREIERLQRALSAAQGQPPLSPAVSTSSLPESAPSFDNAASPSTSASSVDQAPTPPPIQLEHDSNFDMKQFNDSHSAEMCPSRGRGLFIRSRADRFPWRLDGVPDDS